MGKPQGSAPNVALEQLCATKSEGLCLGSLVGENPNHGATEEKGLSFGKQVPLVW